VPRTARECTTNIERVVHGSWLANITRGPAIAPVRDAALALTYVVAREDRHAAVVRCEDADGSSRELARSARRMAGAGWGTLARAILQDATVARPAAKLCADLARGS
jgi:hypothetical protein